MTWFLAQGGRYQLNKLRFQTVCWIRFILKQKNTRIIETKPQRFAQLFRRRKKDLKILKKHFPTKRPQQFLETESSVWTGRTYSTTWRYWDIHTYIHTYVYQAGYLEGRWPSGKTNCSTRAKFNSLSLYLLYVLRMYICIIYIYISSTLPDQSKSG